MNSKLLIIASTISALAGLACADVLIFENDNPQFELGYASALFPSTFQTLDITQDASNQPPAVTPKTSIAPGAFFLTDHPAFTSGDPSYIDVDGFTNLRLALGTPVTTQLNDHGDWREITLTDVPMNAPTGVTVDATTNFVTQALDIFISNTNLPEGSLVSNTTITIPVELTISGQPHYGFVEIEKQTSDDRYSWNATRWGYDTTPNTTFVIPTSCGADLDNSGHLNHFDISAFLSAYGQGNLSVDFSGDGQLNFFDVSAYINLYMQGCQ